MSKRYFAVNAKRNSIILKIKIIIIIIIILWCDEPLRTRAYQPTVVLMFTYPQT